MAACSPRLFIVLMAFLFTISACSSDPDPDETPTTENQSGADADATGAHPDDAITEQPGCGGVTHDGVCVGDTAMWCDFSVYLKSQSCAQNGGTGCQNGACRGISFGFPCDERNLCADRLKCRNNTCTTADPGMLDVEVIGWGTVTSDSSDELDCSRSCLVTEPGGTTVSLRATPDPNWKFSGWSDACQGQSDTVQVELISHVTRKCTAIFEQTHSNLDIAVLKGRGKIQSNPPGIDCTTHCNASFEVGQTVTLTATPDPGFEFIGWMGVSHRPANAPAEMSITIAPLPYHEYYAEFRTLVNYSLEVTGPGRVLSDTQNLNIDCPGTCSAILIPNERYDLIAIPDAGAQFVKWDGDEHCHLSENTGYTLEISDYNSEPPTAMHCTALFEEIPPPTTFPVTVQITGAGSVSSEPAGIDCPDTSCSARFNEGFNPATLIARPAPNATFVGWTNLTSPTSSDCAGSSTRITLQKSEALDCLAKFTQP